MSTQIFPNLEDEQVAVAFADVNTGIVLNDKFEYAIGNTQKVYSVFNLVDEALQFAKAVLSERKNVECLIFGKDEKLLFFINPEKITSY